MHPRGADPPGASARGDTPQTSHRRAVSGVRTSPIAHAGAGTGDESRSGAGSLKRDERVVRLFWTDS